MAGTLFDKLIGPRTRRTAAILLVTGSLVIGCVWTVVLVSGGSLEPFWPEVEHAIGPGPGEWFAMQYDLGPGEIARLSAPPFQSAPLTPWTTGAPSLFHAGRTMQPHLTLRGSWTIFSTMKWCGDFTPMEWERPQSALAALPVSGDWTLRPTAPRAERLRVVESILRKHLRRHIVIEAQSVRREVVVVRLGGIGYRPQRLDPLWPANQIQILADKSQYAELLPSYGTLRDLYSAVEDLTGVQIVDESMQSHLPAQWTNNFLPGQTVVVKGQRGTIDAIFANLAAQTSLRFEREVRDVEVWSATEEAPGP